MGKAAAVILLIVVGLVVLYTACVGLAAVAKAGYRAIWQRAKRQAQWEPHIEMTGQREASVTVRRVARLWGRMEVLAAFPAEIVHVEHLGDPSLLAAQDKANEQAEINNRVHLGE